MTWRKILATLSACLVAGVAFVATSNALTSGAPSIPSNTSASDLPTTALAASDQVSVFDLIGQSPVGISADSLNHVGVLGSTSVGTLYVVPGSSGLCVVLVPSLVEDSAASCGNPSEAPVSIFGLDATNSKWIGGGVYASGRVLSITRVDGSTFTPSLVSGGFTISASDNLPAGSRIELGVK